MALTDKQKTTKQVIEHLASCLEINPQWAVAVAMVESSLGENQMSPTGCRGIFKMSRIAMQDLLHAMTETEDDMIDICCGLLFLRLLLSRWKTMKQATNHFCDPNDRGFYWNRVKEFMGQL